MRLREVERGESLGKRLLIGCISLASRMRLPDAARVAFYHPNLGRPLGSWTQAAMRGASPWTVGERELMAAMVAKWNACTFCLGAHRAVAAKGLPADMVDATLSDPHAAPISGALKATLAFLEKMTLDPAGLTPDDARAVLRSGVTADALGDAIAVASLFNIITRYADALDFAIPTDDEFDRAANMLLRRGYGPP
jgi:alkylhydroperoxidase family enzyme